jgi:hypothetical protein
LGVPKKKTAVVLAAEVLLTDAASIGDDGAKAVVAVPESKAHNSAKTSNDEAIMRSIVWSFAFCLVVVKIVAVSCAGMDTVGDGD